MAEPEPEPAGDGAAAAAVAAAARVLLRVAAVGDDDAAGLAGPPPPPELVFWHRRGLVRPWLAGDHVQVMPPARLQLRAAAAAVAAFALRTTSLALPAALVRPSAEAAAHPHTGVLG
jgi:hypothetical protein